MSTALSSLFFTLSTWLFVASYRKCKLLEREGFQFPKPDLPIFCGGSSSPSSIWVQLLHLCSSPSPAAIPGIWYFTLSIVSWVFNLLLEPSYLSSTYSVHLKKKQTSIYIPSHSSIFFFISPPNHNFLGVVPLHSTLSSTSTPPLQNWLCQCHQWSQYHKIQKVLFHYFLSSNLTTFIQCIWFYSKQLALIPGIPETSDFCLIPWSLLTGCPCCLLFHSILKGCSLSRQLHILSSLKLSCQLGPCAKCLKLNFLKWNQFPFTTNLFFTQDSPSQ